MDYSSTGGMRSPFSPRVRQSITGRRQIGLSSAKKNQGSFIQTSGTGDVIYKTPSFTVETYGLPLPVMVTETLTFASSEVSMRLSPCGWCWLVAGRRALAWPREPAPAPAPASPASSAPAPAPLARELTLPQTDLAHKADLVTLFYDDGAQMPSCIGVSPEGTVRYWPSVGQSEVYVDVSCELGGQECDRLAAMASAASAAGAARPAGLVLATTTCTLVLLKPAVLDGRATVTYHTLRPPSGWLGGIGRRVSLLFFGSMPAHADTKLVGVVELPEAGGAGGGGGGGGGAETREGPGRGEGEEWAGCLALVASGGGAGAGGGGGVLQLWRAGAAQQHALRRLLAEAPPAARLALAPHGDLSGVEVTCVDVRAGGAGGGGADGAGGGGGGGAVAGAGRGSLLLLLLAASGLPRPADVRHAIAYVCVEDLSRPRITALVPVRLPPAGPPGGSPAGPPAGPPGGPGPGPGPGADDPPRFLPLAGHALVYTSTTIALVDSTGCSDKAEYIDVGADGDRVLCAELCARGRPLLVTARHGVLAVSLAPAAFAAPRARASETAAPRAAPPTALDAYDSSLTLLEVDPREVSVAPTDACGKLKTAFLFHLRRDGAACGAVLDATFPPAGAGAGPGAGACGGGGGGARDVDAPLDRAVCAAVAGLLDDVPAGDPRWQARGGSAGARGDVALGSSAALQLAAQLRDKQRALALFVDFLRAAGLWRRLGLVSDPSGDGCVSTVSVVAEAAEKLAVTLALRNLQQAGPAPVIDAAVAAEAEEWAEEDEFNDSDSLSAADVCFRRAGRGPRLLRRVVRAAPPAEPRAAAAHALALLRVATSVLCEVRKVRAQWAGAEGEREGEGQGEREGEGQGAAGGALQPLLPALAALQRRAITECARKCPDASLRAQVLEAAGWLADELLRLAEPLARARATAHLYHRMRRDAIRPFVEEGQMERAAVLAEKFRDFELLVEMCVESGDIERLYSYIDKYAAEGMTETALSCLAARGGRGAAQLVRALSARYGPRVLAWLGSAGAASGPLLALHSLHTAQHAAAARALAQLAGDETRSVRRLATAASLAKLCLLAAEESSAADEVYRGVEKQLALCEQHAALPRALRVHHGLDEEDCRVFSPEELVQMYIESESSSLTEYDYKKALDLTEFIEDDERREELRLKVWCACALRDAHAGAARAARASRATAVGEPAPEDLQQIMFFRLMDLVYLMEPSEVSCAMIPSEERVASAPELQDVPHRAHFEYVLKYGYRYHCQRDDGRPEGVRA